MIYFIQDGDDGPIKIGFSKSPESRLKQLQTGSGRQLRLLHQMSGDTHFERKLHRRFGRSRLHGEWFKPDKDLLDYIHLCAHPRPLKEFIIRDRIRRKYGMKAMIRYMRPEVQRIIREKQNQAG